MNSLDIVAAEAHSAHQSEQAESAAAEAVELTPQHLADQAVDDEAAEREAQLHRGDVNAPARRQRLRLTNLGAASRLLTSAERC